MKKFVLRGRYMLMPLFLGAVVICLLLAVLSVKFKKLRPLTVILTVIALIPTIALGLMTFGMGSIIHYPGAPADTLNGMVSALAAGEYEAAADYVSGDLGLYSEDIPSHDAALWAAACGNLSAACGEPTVTDFTAVVPAELTVMDTDGWLSALAAEAENVLVDTVKEKPVEELFNDARDAYLDGVTEGAYAEALQNLYGRSSEYLQTVSVNVTMRWTPFGWKILPNDALRSALAGYSSADGAVITADSTVAQQLSDIMDTAHKEIVEGLPLLHKAYEIPEDATAAPEPRGVFGETFDTAEVQAVIAQAERLLDGQEMGWNPDLHFWSEEPIRYYYDESILALTWKEIINGNMVTFGEVKFAHSSQIRRALTGNRYNYGIDEYPTKMADNVNAVLAINGDFYGFRDLGITVFQRQLYRHAPAYVDTAYFTADGNMIFSKRGELKDRAAAEQFIADNDVLFAVAFGPVMVENGQPVKTTEYAIGEINDRYSRAAIAQKDDLHYMVMTVNFEGPCQRTCTLEQAVQYISDKNVRMAYTLDGGQTASVVFNGQMVNRPDWGEERTMSDIIYFASAVPDNAG